VSKIVDRIADISVVEHAVLRRAAQVSKPAVSPISKSAGRATLCGAEV
jgi:hypothetical protein